MNVFNMLRVLAIFAIGLTMRQMRKRLNSGEYG